MTSSWYQLQAWNLHIGTTASVSGSCVLQDSVQLATRVLESSLKVSILIGLIFVTFGYSYSFLLLSIYGGAVLTDGSGGL